MTILAIICHSWHRGRERRGAAPSMNMLDAVATEISTAATHGFVAKVAESANVPAKK